MAMENSDTVMPTCRSPGMLEMADTAEAGTDVPSRGMNEHVAEGYVVAHLSVKLARRKVAGVLAYDVVSGAASGDGGTGMFEGNANGDGELEGTEQALSALEIYLEYVSFY